MLRRIVRFICFIALLQPLIVHAEGTVDYTSVVTDGKILLVCAEDGKVFSFADNQVDDVNPVAMLDPETEHILIQDGQPVILQQVGQTLNLLSVDRRQIFSIDMNAALTLSSDDWFIRSPQIQGNKLFFLFRMGTEENERLVQWNLDTKAYRVAQHNSVVDYHSLEDGSAYMAVRDDQHISIYQAFQEIGTDHHLYNIDSKYTCLAWQGEDLWAVNPSENSVVMMEQGKPVKESKYAYASSAWQGAVIHDSYLLLGSNGLSFPNLDVKELPMYTLRLYGSGFNDEIDNAFLQLHPNVMIERVSSELAEEMDLLQAIVSQVIQVDVLTVSNATPGIDSFLKRGYAVDLSVHTGIHEKVKSMYAPIQNFAYDGERINLLPTSVLLKDAVVPIDKNMEAANVQMEEIPDNYIDYLNWMITWYAEYDIDDLMIVPVVLEDNPFETFLYQAIKVYVRYYEKKGESLTFQTDLFRDLLQKVRQAAQASCVVTDTFSPLGLLREEATSVPSPYSIALPLTSEELPRYEGQINGYIVCASSNVQELAMEYIYFRTEHQTMTEQFLLYDKSYEPIERSDYQSMLSAWQDELQKQREKLAVTEDPSEQKDILSDIDRLEKRISNPDPKLVYAVTEEEIMFYQQEIIPNIWYPYANELVERSQRNSWFQDLAKQYLNGRLGDDAFITHLEQRVRMMQMEEGIF